MTNTVTIIKVRFAAPPLAGDPRTDFYFGSLSAIYDLFTPAQIGCKLENLWNNRIDIGRPYKNRLCMVSREVLRRKTREADEKRV